MTETIQVRLAGAADAPGMLRVSRTAFAARRPVDPPADALSDTLADVERRVAVLPTETRRGIAKAMIGGAVSLAVDAGLKRVEVL